MKLSSALVLLVGVLLLVIHVPARAGERSKRALMNLKALREQNARAIGELSVKIERQREDFLALLESKKDASTQLTELRRQYVEVVSLLQNDLVRRHAEIERLTPKGNVFTAMDQLEGELSAALQRRDALEALCQRVFVKVGQPAVRYLLKAVHQPTTTGIWAVGVLGAMGPQAKEALPVLRFVARAEPESTRHAQLVAAAKAAIDKIEASEEKQGR